jgi:uncharacterized protein involved in exopolysaccharide biosynthesis
VKKSQRNKMDNIKNDEKSIDSLSFLDYFIILAKHKRLIITITLSVAIITYILTLRNASFYIAETSILPPQKAINLNTNQFFNQGGYYPGITNSIRNIQDLLVEIIKSKALSRKIIEKFNLKEYYGKENIEGARETLFSNLTIDPDFTNVKRLLPQTRPSPLTRIYVMDIDSQRAADIANTIVEELKNFIINIAISEASQRRLFFEEQLEKASEALVKSEEEIKMFQENTGMLTVEAQTKMVIEKIANLQAQITAKEIELEVMKSYSTVRNPDFQRVEETIRVLKKELAKLEADEGASKKFLIPTGTIPALGLEYKRIFRQLKFNETLYEIMIKQYEIAKIDESKDAALIQVIDKAVPPDNAIKVRIFGRKKALVFTFLAFFISCFLAFALEFQEKHSKNNEYSKKMETLKKYLSFKKRS